MEQDFAGKVALVTGAARGLGLVTVKALLSRGASVVLVDIDGNALSAAMADLDRASGQAIAVTANVARQADCFAAVAKAIEAFGRLDVLANVAGILGMHHVRDVKEGEFERMLSVNVAGPFYLCQAAIPHLIESRGNIVNVASSGGVQGSAYIVPYTATKAALIQMTRSLAMEFMKEPIRINAVSPGPMLTGIADGLDFPVDADPDLIARFAGIRHNELSTEGVAETILFLASDRAHTIHGANFIADKGSTAG